MATREIELLVEEAWIDVALSGRPSFETVIASDGRRIRFRSAPLQPPGAPPPASQDGRRDAPPADADRPVPTVLVVGHPMEIVFSSLAALRNLLLIAVPLTLMLSAAGGLFLVRRALAPVDRMIETARGIEESDLDRRIGAGSKGELGRLAATLNAMPDRLERAFHRQRQFTGDASDELRTPLSVIEAEATLALRRERPPQDYRDALATISEEAQRMNRLIDQLLLLARADAGAHDLAFGVVDLGA